MQLYLIDAIGPFFRHHHRGTINWSKIPFADLPVSGQARTERFASIRADMSIFAQRVAALGFNAVSLDDLAHLADHPSYTDATREQVQVFRHEFRSLFRLLQDQGLAIYLTFDVMTYAPEIKARLGGREGDVLEFLESLVDGFLVDFPQVAGLIVRIGECDGIDVHDHFRSELFLRTPAMVNRFLRRLLPVMERHDRRLILRTWTVGAYPVGDLMWHRGTFADALQGIHSSALALSMKYGESDFFRFLPLNRNFFRTDLPKLIELQTRREYEGCGEYPSFVGWDYERYAEELKQAPNMLGITVWCQTGGWVPFRRLAFLEPGSLWTEINTFVTVKIFRDGWSAERALGELAPEGRRAEFLEFFRLDDDVIKELLYVPAFAAQKLFFRRVRIPTLLGVHWSTIFVNPSLRKLMHHFVREPETTLRQGYAAFAKLKRMKALAAGLELPQEDIDFMKRTFKMLLLARQYYFSSDEKAVQSRLRKARKKYKRRYPKSDRPRYSVRLDFEPSRLRGPFVGWLLAVALRKRRGYRLVDHLFTLRLMSIIYLWVRTARPEWIPKLARKRAMGIDTVFR